MGWLWGSSAPSSDAQSSTQHVSSQPELQSTSIPTAPVSPSASSPTPNTPLSRDEAAEAELRDFISTLEAESTTSASKTKSKIGYQRTPRSAPSSSSSPNVQSDNSEEALSYQLLPSTMSCRSAFDSAFYCQSLGGQFNNLYRYGKMRNCSELWSDFWFCMKTKSYTDEERATMIKERYRVKEEFKYGGRVEESREDGTGTGRGSSTDIWKERDHKMAWGEAFSLPVPKEWVNDPTKGT